MTPTETPGRQRVPAAFRTGFVAAVMIVTFGGPQASAQFTPGNIVVLRIGNGTSISSGAAAPGTLIEINSATGVPTGSVVALPIATAANSGGITFSISTTTAASLHRSTDGTFLNVAGYDAPVGSAGVASSASFATNRTIAQIGSSGAVSTQRLTDTSYSGGDVRAVISNGTQYWLGGDASSTADRGVRFVANNSAASSTRLVNANVRDVNIFNNRLFDSTSTAISVVGGSPPPTSGTQTPIPVTNGSNINGFVFFDRDAGVGDASLGGLDTLYFADGSNIIKLEFSGSSWINKGIFNSNNLGNVLFGLTGALNGGTVELFATDTSASGSLAKITDTSTFGTDMIATDMWSLTAGANFTFRGVDFAPTPVPEPATVLAVVAIGLGLARLRRRKTSAGRPTA
ncbi:MAG TPA: PEP-CTERM sorting domain-containing protein [Fimbriiglobus sp.]|nr:PEP-CTERM sorting domain-containing protein [Fimbriiglobus sp.]